MNNKIRFSIIRINVILIALLYSLVTVNKTFLRPNLNHIPFFQWFLGCLPNFLAAYIITMAPIVATLLRAPRNGRRIVYISGVIVFLIFTIEEFKPIWGASETFDVYDIVTSGLGVILAFLTYEFILLRQRNKITETG
jgi:hypothetical protein